MVSGKRISLQVDEKEPVGFVKKLVEENEGIPFNDQKLIFGEKILRNGKALSDYDIKDGDEVMLVVVEQFVIPIIFDQYGPGCDKIEIRGSMTSSIEAIKEALTNYFDVEPRHMGFHFEGDIHRIDGDESMQLGDLGYQKGQVIICEVVGSDDEA
jgi:hypothetical protein